jgi:hypothetical protein
MRFPIQIYRSVIRAEVYGFCLRGKLVEHDFQEGCSLYLTGRNKSRVDLELAHFCGFGH